MKIICKTEPREAKNITVGNSYNFPGEELPRDWVQIVNDSGNLARYSSALFEEELTKKTERQFFEDLTINVEFAEGDNDANDVYCDMYLGNSNFATILSADSPNFTCGAKTIDGIGNLFFEIEKLLNFAFLNGDYIFTTNRKTTFLKLFEIFIQKIKEAFNGKVAFISFSNYETEDEVIETVLDDISDWKTDWVENPNSENNIKIWTLKTN